MTRRAAIIGTGSYLPARIVSNDELARTVDTSDDWIVERTGIRARHIVADDDKTSDLATMAAGRALEAAGIEPGSVGLIVLATTTPDKTFPATAVQVQANLGIDDCVAFDVQAVCSRFLYALSVADAILCRDPDLVALVIGAETFTRLSIGKIVQPVCFLATAPARLFCNREQTAAVFLQPALDAKAMAIKLIDQATPNN
jgi:3-oxoacyl-[acyl-carrier-protein] synthase-3